MHLIHLLFDKDDKNTCYRKDNILKRMIQGKLNVIMVKNALDACTNSIPNGLKTSVKSEIPKLLEGNIGTTSHIKSF